MEIVSTVSPPHLDLLQSHRSHGHGNTVPPREPYQEGPQVTDGSHQEDGIQGSTILRHDAELGI